MLTWQAVQPENVVLEVCRSRAAVMYDAPAKPAGPSGRGQGPNDMSLRCVLSPSWSLIPLQSGAGQLCCFCLHLLDDI